MRSEDLPQGDIAGVRLDGKLLDLWTCILEPIAITGRTVELPMLVSRWHGADPARLRLRFRDAKVGHLPGTENAIARLPLRYLDAIQHDGLGAFLVTADADHEGRDPRGWSFAFSAAAIEAAVEVLDHRKPPYVAVFWDEGTGLWDKVTRRGALSLDDLDLPEPVRAQVKHWEDRASAGIAGPDEAAAVVAGLRAAWPDSVVSNWDNDE